MTQTPYLPKRTTLQKIGSYLKKNFFPALFGAFAVLIVSYSDTGFLKFVERINQDARQNEEIRENRKAIANLSTAFRVKEIEDSLKHVEDEKRFKAYEQQLILAQNSITILEKLTDNLDLFRRESNQNFKDMNRRIDEEIRADHIKVKINN